MEGLSPWDVGMYSRSRHWMVFASLRRTTKDPVTAGPSLLQGQRDSRSPRFAPFVELVSQVTDMEESSSVWTWTCPNRYSLGPSQSKGTPR